MNITNHHDRLTKLYGIRAGRVSLLCDAMGWEVKPYQKLMMMRMMQRSRYKPFIPMRRPPSFDKLRERMNAQEKKEWHMFIIEEAAFLQTKGELAKYRWRGVGDNSDKYQVQVHGDFDHQLDAFRYVCTAMQWDNAKLTLWQRIKMWFRHFYYRVKAFIISQSHCR